MGRGTTIKSDTPEKLILLRPMITRRYELTVDHGICCGCGTCEAVCPREAVELSEPVVEDGRLVSKPRVDIDATKCSFCGECVALCPTHALAITVNGEPEIPVIKGQAFPLLIRTMRVNGEACSASTDTAYIDECPVGAISAEIERDEGGEVLSVTGVDVDRKLCINCTHCMEEGPDGGFEVVKPYKGRTWLNTNLCPDGCQACVDACPTSAMTYDGEKVSLDNRFCLFCGACQRACPVEGAVKIVRTGFVHTPIESGAWGDALGKIVSYKEYGRELDIKGQLKRRKLVVEGLLVGVDPADGDGHK